MKFEELTIGRSAEFSKTVTDADVMAFAEVKTRFGGRIAHGMLSAGFVSAAIGNKLPGAGSIYLAQTLRFTLPVRIGDTITATIAVTEILSKRRVKLSTICTNQNGDKVLDGEATVMLDEANG
jgi:3-hydroxybutyryl-CoA dehydratase